MEPKPKHLGPEYGAQFSDSSVVAAYVHRPPYPPDLFDLLASLVVPEYPTLLDLGCGPGPIARSMAERVERIDALDCSAPMIALGKTLPGGDNPRIRWIVGSAEEAQLDPPYGLIVAGASLHWMDWSIVMPRLRSALAPGAVIVIVEEGHVPAPWDAAVGRLCADYSTNRAYQPYDLVEELARRSLFQVAGKQQTAPIPYSQTLEQYIESFHARNGFSRDRMQPQAAADFDQNVRDLMTAHVVAGQVHQQVFASITWGTVPDQVSR